MNEGALPELPGGWMWTRLGDIGTINPKTKGENIEDDTEVTFLPMRCVEELTGCFDLSFTKRFSEVKKGYTPFTDGDLIFAKITPCMENGKIAIVQGLKNGMGFGSTEFHVIRLSKIIPGKFFFYFLVRKELRKDAKRNMTGSAGQLRVSTSYMQQIIFPLPPLPEQRAIVSKIEQLFSDLDNGIESFKKAQAQLKLYRQSVLKAACEGKLVPTEAELARAEGRDYEAADVLLARIMKERREKWNGKDKNKERAAPDTNDLPALKDGWCWVETNLICKTITDGDHQPPPQSEEGIPFLVISNIKEGKLDFNQTRFVPEYYYQAIQEHRIPKKGDILYSVVGSYGIPAMVDVDRKFCFQRHIALFKPSEFIHGKYMLLALKSDFTFKQATAFATGTAQLTVSLSGLRRIKIPLPPLAEQRRIVAEVERRLSVSNKMEATITESLQKAESLRQSILKKAFEGKLLNKKELEKARNATDWEPAEKLLERIRQEKARAGEKKRK